MGVAKKRCGGGGWGCPGWFFCVFCCFCEVGEWVQGLFDVGSLVFKLEGKVVPDRFFGGFCGMVWEVVEYGRLWGR